jgi:predicted transcriptional regulator
MASPSFQELSRRERQVLDLVYRRGRATANEVLGDLDDPPSYSSVRSVLRLLEKKGFLHHEEDGPRHVYIPVIRRDRARRSALKHVLRTFFDDSPEEVVNALLDVSKSKLSAAELSRIESLIAKAKKEGR